MSSVGYHAIAELSECDPDCLSDPKMIIHQLQLAAEQSGATWLKGESHQFNPEGVTAVGLLSESHIAVHTWPTECRATLDCFTCGDSCKPELACKHFAEWAGAQHVSVRVLERTWE